MRKALFNVTSHCTLRASVINVKWIADYMKDFFLSSFIKSIKCNTQCVPREWNKSMTFIYCTHYNNERRQELIVLDGLINKYYWRGASRLPHTIESHIAACVCVWENCECVLHSDRVAASSKTQFFPFSRKKCITEVSQYMNARAYLAVLFAFAAQRRTTCVPNLCDIIGFQDQLVLKAKLSIATCPRTLLLICVLIYHFSYIK